MSRCLVTMPRISYKKQLLQWYFRTLESLFDDVVCEENLEMMIDLVEGEEGIEIQVLLGDYLDNSDSDIEMNSSSTSSPTTISSLSSLNTSSLSVLILHFTGKHF